MKANRDLNPLLINVHLNHQKSTRFLWSATLIAAVPILLCTLVNAEPAANPPNFCRQTAQAALTSCRRAAESDFWVAWGKCDNLSHFRARESCRNQASADLDDSMQSCEEQNDVRLAACDGFGPAQYDPIIDPSNFVAQVDNPYFPLTPGTTSSTKVKRPRVSNMTSSR